LLYLSLKGDTNNSVWKDFKSSKINELDLVFNHSKINETKILTEKKYSSKLDPKLTDLDEVLKSALNNYEKYSSRNFNRYFNYEALAWLAKQNAKFDSSALNCRYANVLKDSVDDSDTLLKYIIEENNRNPSGVQEKFEKLSLSQMQKLMKMDDKIRNSDRFINTYLRKILPTDLRKLKINSEEFKELENFANALSNSNYQYELQYLVLHLKLKNAIVEQLQFDENDFIK